jgi:hypothetical protein
VQGGIAVLVTAIHRCADFEKLFNSSACPLSSTTMLVFQFGSGLTGHFLPWSNPTDASEILFWASLRLNRVQRDEGTGWIHTCSATFTISSSAVSSPMHIRILDTILLRLLT